MKNAEMTAQPHKDKLTKNSEQHVVIPRYDAESSGFDFRGCVEFEDTGPRIKCGVTGYSFLQEVKQI